MMTFKELKKLVKLPLYKEQRVPTVKALEESGVSVVAEKILENHGSISVYQNGYVIYRAHKRVTVFSLRNCVHYKYDALEGAGHHIEEEEFDEYEWHIRLVLEGEDRIFMNYEIIQGKWMPSREDREYREEILEGVDEAVSTLERMISEERVEELLSTLTDLQRKVVHLRTGETKSAVAEEPPKQEDSEKDAAESAEETPVVEEDVCMDAEDGEEEKPRRSTAKQSTEYYKAHQEDGKPKEKDAPPVDEDAEPAPKKKGRLSFDDEQQGGIVRGAGLGIKKVAKKGVDTATGFAHNKVHQVEKENSGVESAHKSEETLEELYRFSKGRKKTREKSARAEKRGGEDQKASRLKFSESEGGTAENAAEPSLKKKQPQPPPTAAGGEATKTVGSKFYQKKQYKDAYAAAKRGQKAGNAASKQAATAANTLAEKAKAAVQEIVVQNKTLWAGLGIAALMLMLIMGAFSSCSAAIQGTGSTFIGTTYPSKDADMKGAEEDYLELEKKLDEQIRQMESTHPGYDEYRYQLDEIGHDPYQLISHLTAVYEQFTRGQVKNVIKSLFEQQYLLKVWETIEIRTRMETRVGIRPTIDAFGNVSMETYTYQEEVEYEYKILNVLLKNKGFDTIARKNMDRKQTGRYDAYNLTYGNRPELFGAGSPTYSGGTTGSIGSGGSGGTGGSSGGGFRYDIPEEALSDEKFARVIAEAEKYLGMPYVWGGSSPSTSFDCSGFVCWVINNCGNGWNVGRTTANGLRGKCSYVSPANAQPGDLIFFEKTYNTVGASHVGIYVGNGMMIHCGDPISYTSINSTYWQNHFLGFGRIK